MSRKILVYDYRINRFVEKEVKEKPGSDSPLARSLVKLLEWSLSSPEPTRGPLPSGVQTNISEAERSRVQIPPGQNRLLELKSKQVTIVATSRQSKLVPRIIPQFLDLLSKRRALVLDKTQQSVETGSSRTEQVATVCP